MEDEILFKSEINSFLKELFYENWMDDEDWLMFIEGLTKTTGISIKSLSNNLQKGIKNGHSLEKQFELIKNILKNGKEIK